MQIHLKLNRRQLDVLLSHLESTLTDALPIEQQMRGPQLADAALRLPPHGYSYDNAQIAPVYTQLVRHWAKPDTPSACVMAPERQREWAVRRADAEVSSIRYAGVDRA